MTIYSFFAVEGDTEFYFFSHPTKKHALEVIFLSFIFLA